MGLLESLLEKPGFKEDFTRIFEEKKTVVEIMGHFQLSNPTTYRLIKALGLVKSGSRTERQRMNAITLHQDFFESWSPEMARILGYIWADGCVSTTKGCPDCLRFECQERDVGYLEQIRNVLGSNHKIFPHTKRGKVSGVLKTCMKLLVTNRRIAKSLVDHHHVLPGKSKKNLPFPTNIPNGYLGQFVGGFFDGDGSICTHLGKKRRKQSPRLLMIGSPKFMAGLYRKIRESISVSHSQEQVRILKSGRTMVTHRWSSLKDLELFYHWFYPKDEVLCLERKKTKLEEILRMNLEIPVY